MASILELEATLNTQASGGMIFDYYESESFKFAAISAENNQILIGHYLAKSGWSIDATFDSIIEADKDYDLAVSLKGRTVSVSVKEAGTQNWQAMVSYAFNAAVVDGYFGLLSKDGVSSFDQVKVKTNDPAFNSEDGSAMTAASSPTDPTEVMSDLSYTDLDPIIEAAINRWTGSTLFDEAMLARLDDVNFVIADLAGDTLALAVDDTVIIDVDAAGHGWFVDDTPYQDTEFVPQNSDEVLTANEPSEAYGDMDLLTVVMHELGHVFGYQDMDPETNDAEIMNGTLDEGVRYLPEGTFTEQVHDNSDSLISVDLTPDEDIADEAMDTLVNDNPWLVRYLVYGATDETDPNGDIAVVIDDEVPAEDGAGTDDTSSNPGTGKKN